VVAADTHAPAALHAQRCQSPTASKGYDRAMRVLLVEDDTMIGESLREALRRQGMAADWVRDGRAADACWPANASTPCCSTWACRSATAWRCCAPCARAATARR
jgi:hypothetical protein